MVFNHNKKVNKSCSLSLQEHDQRWKYKILKFLRKCDKQNLMWNKENCKNHSPIEVSKHTTYTSLCVVYTWAYNDSGASHLTGILP